MKNLAVSLMVDKLISIEDPTERMEILKEVSKSPDYTESARKKIMKEILSRIK